MKPTHRGVVSAGPGYRSACARQAIGARRGRDDLGRTRWMSLGRGCPRSCACFMGCARIRIPNPSPVANSPTPELDPGARTGAPVQTRAATPGPGPQRSTELRSAPVATRFTSGSSVSLRDTVIKWNRTFGPTSLCCVGSGVTAGTQQSTILPNQHVAYSQAVPGSRCEGPRMRVFMRRYKWSGFPSSLRACSDVDRGVALRATSGCAIRILVSS